MTQSLHSADIWSQAREVSQFSWTGLKIVQAALSVGHTYKGLGWAFAWAVDRRPSLVAATLTSCSCLTATAVSEQAPHVSSHTGICEPYQYCAGIC